MPVSGGQGDVRANIGSTEAWANGEWMRLEEPARGVEGTLYVPDRFPEPATGMRASCPQLRWGSGQRTALQHPR